MVPTLAGLVQATVDYDDLAINFESDVPIKRIGEALRELRTQSAADLLPSVEESAITGIKFSECLPVPLATQMLQTRLQNVAGIAHALQEEVRFVI